MRDILLRCQENKGKLPGDDVEVTSLTGIISGVACNPLFLDDPAALLELHSTLFIHAESLARKGSRRHIPRVLWIGNVPTFH